MRRTCIFLTLYLLLLFLIPSLSLSQTRSLDFNRNIAFFIPYIPDPQSCNKNGNEILIEMAKEILKEPWKVSLGISFDLRIRMLWDFSERPLLAINVIGPAITGDTRYRLFDISKVLMPSRMNVTIRLENKTDSTVFREMEIKNRPFGIADTMAIEGDWLSCNPSHDTLKLRSIELFYDERARNDFFSQSDQINDYYACRALLDSLDRLVKSIDLKDWSQLPINFIRIREIDHAIHLMEKRRFPETLCLQEFDPMNWREIFTAADKCSRSLKFTFKDELMNSGAITGEGNLELFSDYLVSRIFNYIELSHTISEINGEIYSDWLDNYFQFRAFEDEPDLINLIARKMFPDASQDTVLTYISEGIYRAYQRLAKKLIDHFQYADAYTLMTHASLINAGKNFIPKMVAEDEILTEAATGIYSSYIGIAKTCLNNRKYPMAENYLEKATDFRKKHPGIVFSDTLYNSVFSDLFLLRKTECDNLLAKNRYSDALRCYLYFEYSYDALQLLPVREKLEQKKREAWFGLFLDVIGPTFLIVGQD